MKLPENHRSQSYQNLFQLVLLIMVTLSCNSTDSKLLKIDPRTFVENEISLSDIADDVTYIPLDNSFPISIIYYYTSINILKTAIYLSARDIGIIRFDRDGSNPRVIGKRGRGPGEWYYCMSVAVDDRTETIYVMDDNSEIKVYHKSGLFKGTIKLPESDDGIGFSDVTFYKSKLFASQYIGMGQAKYNWIISDTSGKIIREKLNSIAPFTSNLGGGGGTFKFEDKISYWDWYNDTIFTVSPDLNYKASYIFSLGEGKIPFRSFSTTDLLNTFSKYYTPIHIQETNRFLLYSYGHNKKGTLSLIEKKTKKVWLTNADSRGGGIKNDLDNGLPFNPVNYFTEDGREFLLGFIDAFQLKGHTSGEEFRNTGSKFPEKKNALMSFASKTKETDNQILMIVRLKK